MRLRPIHWFLLSVMFFIAGAYVWHRADKWQEGKNQRLKRTLAPPSPAPSGQKPSAKALQATSQFMPLMSAAAPLSSVPDKPIAKDSRFPYRVRNTTKTAGQLARSESGILLENALI